MAAEVATRLWKTLRFLRLASTNRYGVVLIPTGEFNLLVQRCLEGGWQRIRIYSGPDAWVDYGRVDLQKNGRIIRFEWDNWDEGYAEGRKADILACFGRGYQFSRRIAQYHQSS